MQWIFGTGHHSVFLDPQTTRNKWQANAINLPWLGMLYTIHSDSKWWWLGDGFLELSHDYPMIIPRLSLYVPKSLYPYITPLYTIVVTIVIIIPSKHPIMIPLFSLFYPFMVIPHHHSIHHWDMHRGLCIGCPAGAGVSRPGAALTGLGLTWRMIEWWYYIYIWILFIYIYIYIFIYLIYTYEGFLK